MTHPAHPRRGRGAFARREFLSLAIASAGAMALGRSSASEALGAPGDAARPDEFNADVPLLWFSLASQLVRSTPGFTPPVAARMFGYAGVSLYEAVVPGMRRHRSLAGQLNGLRNPPGGHPHGRALNWPLVANAALAGSLRRMFPAGPATEAIDHTEQSVADSIRGAVGRGVATRSRQHGERAAAAIGAWAAGDGGHEGYLRNFPESYVPPAGPGMWEPTPPGSLRALLPQWGANRTMLAGLAERAPGAPPLPYSTDPSSAFYAEAYEVYETVNTLTPDRLEIARFWSDDPVATSTPAGHSVSILSQALAARDADLGFAAQAYAKLGIALTDAFVCCWATKYRYNLLRPITYVHANIDSTWGDPLPLTTPPFPEHTSGHSVQSGAAARVLTELFGPVAFTDHTHDNRGLAPRHFTSFDHAAEEAAISRLYGGIHYRHAITEGLRQGRIVGDAVSQLRFER